MSYTSHTMLHITAAHVDLGSRALVIPYTQQIMVHITTGPGE